jgi:integrase
MANDGKLSAKKVAALIKAGVPGRHHDGDSLYLQIRSSTSASWVRRYQVPGAAPRPGKKKPPNIDMGLGSARTFTLAEARERNRELTKMLADKINPLSKRREERAQEAAEAMKAISFGEAARRYFEAHSPSWRSPVHRRQWASSMLGTTPSGRPVNPDYCKPLRDLPVKLIDTAHVMSVIGPLWTTKPETASRLRVRIEGVLSWAVASKYRQAGDVASWEIIHHLLPPRTKVKPVRHFTAMDYRDLPTFMADLRGREGSAARALEFLILTAARTAEALQATWSEVDLAEALWTVPGARMKSGKEHRVPLAPELVDILHDLPHQDNHPFLFLSAQPGRPLSPESLLRVMRRMERSEAVHGFRSSFRVWAGEQSSTSPDIIEMCLAHKVGGNVERAYQRSDLLDRRRQLMENWIRHCLSGPAAEAVTTGKVLSIRSSR